METVFKRKYTKAIIHCIDMVERLFRRENKAYLKFHTYNNNIISKDSKRIIILYYSSKYIMFQECLSREANSIGVKHSSFSFIQMDTL